TDIDVDNTANTFQASSGTTSHGSYTMTAGGAWTFTLDNSNNAVNALNASATLTDTVSVQTQAGTSQTVTITINGANDAAVVAGSASGSVVEAGSGNGGGTPVAAGTLTDSDVDNVANTFQASSGTTAHGSYTMAAGGAWTFTLDNTNSAVNALNV